MAAAAEIKAAEAEKREQKLLKNRRARAAQKEKNAARSPPLPGSACSGGAGGSIGGSVGGSGARDEEGVFPQTPDRSRVPVSSGPGNSAAAGSAAGCVAGSAAVSVAGSDNGSPASAIAVGFPASEPSEHDILVAHLTCPLTKVNLGAACYIFWVKTFTEITGLFLNRDQFEFISQ